MYKILFISIAVSVVSKCSQKNNGTHYNMKEFRATSQRWMGGAIGSGKGTDYRFYFPIEDTVFEFDSVWVDGYRLQPEKIFDPASPDTLIVEARLIFPAKGISHDDGPKPLQPIKVNLPSGDFVNCKAVVSFVYKSEKENYRLLQCVGQIIELKPLMYE